MRKLFVIALSLALTIAASSVALAAGNGVGLAAAPGQSVNFYKGITTIVSTTVNIVESKENQTVVSDPVVVETENKSSADTVTEDIVTASTETKTDKDGNVYTRNVTSTQTKTTSVIKEWVDTTTAVTTSYYEIPVTTTYTAVRTLKHQGAPGSNGKVISDATDTKVDIVKGAPILLSSETVETIISGAITETTSISYSEPEVKKDGWHLGQY